MLILSLSIRCVTIRIGHIHVFIKTKILLKRFVRKVSGKYLHTAFPVMWLLAIPTVSFPIICFSCHNHNTCWQMGVNLTQACLVKCAHLKIKLCYCNSEVICKTKSWLQAPDEFTSPWTNHFIRKHHPAKLNPKHYSCILSWTREEKKVCLNPFFWH